MQIWCDIIQKCSHESSKDFSSWHDQSMLSCRGKKRVETITKKHMTMSQLLTGVLFDLQFLHLATKDYPGNLSFNLK